MTRDPFASMYQLYRADLALVQDLGLAIPAALPTTHEWFTLGEAKRDGWAVTIEIMAMPAQFYRFTVATSEGARYVIETGSGTLHSYWPSVLLVAEGMFCTTRVDSPAANSDNASLDNSDTPSAFIPREKL